MRIVHFGHACVLIETDGARILFDPGTFSSGFDNERDLDAIVITHQHFDHLDREKLAVLAKENPHAQLIVDPGSEEIIQELGLTATTAKPGDSFQINHVDLHAVGGVHAAIHGDIPRVPNIGYILDDNLNDRTFYHPGDSFFVPEQRIDILGLPSGAPWLKAGEAIDFLRAIAPQVAFPIHEKTLANPAMHYGFFDKLKPADTTFTVLTPGEAAEL